MRVKLTQVHEAFVLGYLCDKEQCPWYDRQHPIKCASGYYLEDACTLFRSGIVNGKRVIACLEAEK